MPTRERVEQLISLIEQGKVPEAIQEFYAPNATAQDNKHRPRAGQAANVEHERKWLDSVAQVHENKALSYVVDGDRVAIQWVHDFTKKDGRHLRMEEVAMQTWQGDKIVQERFFYDSSSLQA